MAKKHPPKELPKTGGKLGWEKKELPNVLPKTGCKLDWEKRGG
jgi:hypothetical protein